MHCFKKNKIYLGILLLPFFLQSHAAELETRLDNPVVSNTPLKKDVVIEGLYDITFNKEFKSLASVLSDSTHIFIPMKSLDPLLSSKFDFTDHTVTKNNEAFLSLDKSLVSEINNDDMRVAVILTSEFFYNSQTVKRINHVERSVSRIDTNNVVNYVTNNYQLNIQDGKNLLGYLETKYSNKDYWSIQNKMLYTNSKLVRLSTSYKKEFADKSSLQIGDINEDNLGQIASVNGFGIKYATNYFNNSLNSNLNDSLPQFSVNGFSLTPSQFNLYSNSNALVTNEINSGNYNIIMPYNNGGGVYSGYVKDYLGNVQQFNIPYYNSTKLVKGLEYSVSMAKLRKNQYLNSFDYDKPFFSGIAKYGITNNWTHDLSIHYSEYFKNIYTGSNFYIDPKWGLFQVGMNYNSNNEALYNLGWEYYVNSAFVFKLTNSFSKDANGFCIKYTNDCIKKQNRYFMGYRLPEKMGNLSFQRLEEEKQYNSFTSNSLSWTKSISNKINVSLILEKIRYSKEKEDKKLFMLLSYNFDEMYNANVNYQKNSNNSSYQTRIAKSEDKEHPEYGYGYASIGNTSSSNSPNYNINYFANLKNFSYSVQANKRNEDVNTRVGIRGSALYIPEDKFLNFTKNTTGIILVDTDNKDSVPLEVYHQNKLSGLTDNDGKYVISKGVPYATEKVELSLKTLPIDKNFEQFRYDVVVPEYGAAKIKFKQIMQDYVIVISNLSEGSTFKIGTGSYVVGKNGETSVDKEGLATFSGNNCTFNIKLGKKQYTCE